MNKLGLILALLLITTVLSNCGIYSFSGASLHPDDKTVTIKYFPNRATLVNPNLSQYFTEELKDRFVSQTSLELVDFNGDLIFEGEITKYFTQPVAVTSNEQAQFNQLTIGVRVKYTSFNNPDFDFDNEFVRFSEYESDKSLSDEEDRLVEEIVKELIEDIFNKAVVNW